MNDIDRQYKELLDHILHFGIEKQDRTGTGTKSIFGWQIRHNMSDGFPLLTTKKMAFKTMVTELLWFLRGDTNIKYLVDNDCHIWTGDAIKNYEKHNGKIHPHRPKQEYFENLILNDDKFAKKWGELGPIYGKQWRKWELANYSIDHVEYGLPNDLYVDQIQNLINELKTNPDSRRLMVSAWNVGELDQMVLPPCHFSWQCYSHEQDGKRYLSLAWNQRSVDTFLGLPFNIASYGLLLEIIAKTVNMIPDQLIGNLGDVHLYNNHIEQAKEQISRSSFELPKLKMNPIFLANLEHKGFDEAVNGQVNFKLENYQSHPSIKAPLSN